MSDKKTYLDHLALLKKNNPSLAYKIETFSDPSFINTPFSKQKECQEQEILPSLNQLNIENCDVLYVYGMGAGHFYQVLRPWLKNNPYRYLVFLEDDLSAIQYFLNCEEATPLLHDTQVEIVDITEAQDNRTIIRSLTEDHILRSFAITAIPDYSTHKATQFAILKDLIEFEAAEQNIRNQELAQFGVIFFNNFYRNLLQLPQSHLADHLYQQFKNIPAIICGAGPSLTKQAQTLQNLRDKALIFGPGSALNILTHQGVWPHFGVNVDPTPETFHRQITNRAFEIPIFYRHRLYHEALTAIHAPRLFLSGAVYYSIPKWFEEQLNLPSLQLEGGYNVVHTALEIANFLGCSPIIFVGLDLSYHENEHYATGIEKHPLFPHFDQKTHLGEPIQVKNIHGELVWSYWPWIAEAQWTELYQRLHPELKLINASEEGIGLFSIPNSPLEEVDQLYLSQSLDLDEKVHQAIQKAGKIFLKKEQIEETICKFYASLKQCEIYLNHILKDKLEDKDRLEQEVGFHYLLKQFNDFFTTFVQKDLRQLNRLPEEIKKNKAEELRQERYRFLLQTTKVHLQIIENALKEAKSIETTPQSPAPSSIHQQIYSTYYASGNIYSTSSHPPFQGAHYYFYEEGPLKSEINYKEGVLEGCTKLYYRNGQLKRELHFSNGLREGVEKSWYENGQLFTKVVYHQNKPKQATCWFPDGTLAKDMTI